MSIPVKKLTGQILDIVLAADAEIEGCSAEEISQIENESNVRLPAAYVAFLKEMGRSAGDFLRGDDLFYPDMIGLQDTVEECMFVSDSSAVLAESDFVFAGHHDYVYLYFDTEDGEDPPVYRYIYMAGEDQPEQVFDTFSEWFESSVEDEISLAEY
ncbi:SMI1/KNR4 family protein [Halogeometricum borinquense]|uniref:SMI1/KNR4 family protein n=1 Tax=Halogeometricum borinquense TaxID=60847 RepID=A0A6C0UPC3_9EURY|nr:SMI1/KNR4 family protein [Halogeometricum borinquense]QIB74798.1 SMI1/KNR4 family protein [Halogeometricum borinquense]